ncbi:beta family protein [Euryhalocaulis caribicus]|uniref:beta family protein n=1 Tax=Euryhalocaulis caribicus TaxID=1161401 RepID=UPI0009DBA868|nr:hypothetical protein [Euryhalocaulis caribicus]
MIEHIEYCPTLYTRISEVKALLNLPTSSKDRIFPLLLLRPWPNANYLQSSWDKIREAIGDRPFAVDLDFNKFQSGSHKQAATEFDHLFNSNSGFENYFDAIERIESAVPVIQLEAKGSDYSKQLAHAEQLDRGFFIRILSGKPSTARMLSEQTLGNDIPKVVFIDAEWTRDPLSREAWLSGAIRRVTDIDPGTEIVVAGSSFPESFSEYGPRGEEPLLERQLFNRLVRQHNAASLTYGDWGSTRPPMEPTPMKTVPRIDLPNSNGWHFFRSTDEETYADVAVRTMNDKEWPKDLEIWGTYAIGCTASGEPGAIKAPSTATAARVNIHLHLQAQHGAEIIESDNEEPFTDDL